jgi:hypothetical protein
VEPKACAWFDLNDVSIAEEMAYSLSADDSNANIVDIGAIGGFQVFAIDQGWEIMQLVLLVDDRVDSEMLFGDCIAPENISTVSSLIACNLHSNRRLTTFPRLYQFELLFQDRLEYLDATVRRRDG